MAITGHDCSSKDDISKEIPTKPGNGLILRVYSSKAMAEYPVSNRKGPIKPL